MTLRDFLEHVTYKPGWKFRVDDGEMFWKVYGGGGSLGDIDYRLVATADVIDADDPSKQFQVGFSRRISGRIRHAQWKIWAQELYMLIKEIEEHEIQEFLRFDGKHYIDPHPGRRGNPLQG